MGLVKWSQDNWLTIVLVLTAIVTVLGAVAELRVRLAKLTPEKTDDEKAKLFKARIKVFIQFIKDIVPVGKKKDKGFIDIKITHLLLAVVVAFAIGWIAAINTRPAKVVTETKTVEVEKIVYREASTFNVKKTTVSKTDLKKGVTTVVAIEDSSAATNSELTKDANRIAEGKVEEKNKQSALAFGPGYSSRGVPKIGADFLSGNWMASLNGGQPVIDGQKKTEVEGYLKFVIYLN